MYWVHSPVLSGLWFNLYACKLCLRLFLLSEDQYSFVCPLEGTLEIFFSRMLMLQMRNLKHRKQGFACGYVPDSPESSHVTPCAPRCQQSPCYFHLWLPSWTLLSQEPKIGEVYLSGSSRPHLPIFWSRAPTLLHVLVPPSLSLHPEMALRCANAREAQLRGQAGAPAHVPGRPLLSGPQSGLLLSQQRPFWKTWSIEQAYTSRSILCSLPCPSA